MNLVKCELSLGLLLGDWLYLSTAALPRVPSPWRPTSYPSRICPTIECLGMFWWSVGSVWSSPVCFIRPEPPSGGVGCTKLSYPDNAV